MSLVTGAERLRLDVGIVAERLVDDSPFVGCHRVHDGCDMRPTDFIGIASGDCDEFVILAFLVAVAIEKDAVMATKAIEAGGSRQLIDAAEGVAVSSDDVFVAVANDVELDDAVIILGFGHAFQTKGLQTTPDVVIGKDDDIGDGIDADGDGRVEEGLLDRDDLIVETLRILDSEFLASSLDGLFFSLSFELVHISPPKWFV